MKFPSIDIIIPTYNSSRTLLRCLQSINFQDYPKSKLRIIVVDGGSKDKTLEIIRKYKIKLIRTDPKKQNVEYNKSVGIQASKSNLLFMIDHDNVLPSKKIIKKMVQPFIDDEAIVGVETLHYHYDKRFSLLDRYIALFGVTDPVAYYLGKADRMSYHTNTYDKRYKPIRVNGYFVVSFTPRNLPTIGANGFMVRREILVNNAKVGVREYFHIDVNADLVKKGFNKYAFVDGSISHIGGNTSILKFLERRGMFMKQFYLDKSKITAQKRRYKLFVKGDAWKLIYFILISITLIVPLVDSIRGYLRVRDTAWFLHPVMCLSFVAIYGYAVIEYKMHSFFPRNAI